MPRLNLYEMANPFRGPRASGADFGAAPAQALEGMGNEFAEIGERIQRREENAISDQAFGEVNTQALPLLSDFEKRHDISMPEALSQFQSSMQKVKSDAVSKTKLRPEARAALERQIDNQITQYGKSAIGTRIKAGHDLMLARVNEQFSTGVNQVSAAPSIMQDVIDTNVQFVQSRKDSMDQLTYEAAIKKAHAGPIQAAVTAYAAQGLWDQADALIKDPKTNTLVDPDALRPLRIDVAVGRGKAEKETRELVTNAKQWETVSGAKIDPSKYAELPDFKTSTAAQKIASYKLINGVEPTVEMKQRFFGLEKARDDSLIEQVSDMAPTYGAMSPQEQLKFQLMVKKVWPDRRGEDKFGNPSMFSTIPSQLESIIGGAPASSRPLSGGAPVVQSTLEGVGMRSEGYPIDEKGEFVPGGQKGQAGPGGQRTRLSEVAGDEAEVNLYDSADKMVGLESWIKRNAAKLPLGIGDRMKIDPVYAQAAKASEILQNDVTEGLRNAGGRDANQYRQELKRIVSIDPALMNSTRNYRVEMRTIDKELRSRLKNYQGVAETGATKEMRQDAAAAVATISTIVARLNIPQKLVKTREEYEKLAPGVRFMFGDDPTPLTKGATK